MTPNRPPSYCNALIGAIALLPLAACSGGILHPRGPIGFADDMIMLNSLEIMLAIVIPTIIATFIFAWWFRSGNKKAHYLPHFAYSGRLEIIVWSIPTLVIMFLGGVIWIGSHQLDPFRPMPSKTPPVQVQVVSLDWKWLFIYPQQGIAAVNQLVLPAGVPVHFDLTSASVMDVFFVPQLGSMIYTMNHMVTQLYLQADKPGNYYGESAQYSGDGFSGMHFVLHAVPPAEFTQWIRQTRQSGPMLDRTAYAALSKETMNVTPSTYRAVDPDLFHAIVTQEIPPQPGPTTGSGGVNIHPLPGN
jgi:cytochrome o ubiquinol oxidase subunit 2